MNEGKQGLAREASISMHPGLEAEPSNCHGQRRGSETNMGFVGQSSGIGFVDVEELREARDILQGKSLNKGVHIATKRSQYTVKRDC
jgi:hypothetical protein